MPEQSHVDYVAATYIAVRDEGSAAGLAAAALLIERTTDHAGFQRLWEDLSNDRVDELRLDEAPPGEVPPRFALEAAAAQSTNRIDADRHLTDDDRYLATVHFADAYVSAATEAISHACHEQLDRRALVTNGDAATIARYLPKNYRVVEEDAGAVLIAGIDNSGWTLDGYVIPRLASGLIWAQEIKTSAPRLEPPTSILRSRGGLEFSSDL